MKSSFPISSGEYNQYGAGITVFEAKEAEPLIICFDSSFDYLETVVKTQIRKDDTDLWQEYQPGNMIVAQKVECRLSSPFDKFDVTLTVETN